MSENIAGAAEPGCDKASKEIEKLLNAIPKEGWFIEQNNVKYSPEDANYYAFYGYDSVPNSFDAEWLGKTITKGPMKGGVVVYMGRHLTMADLAPGEISTKKDPESERKKEESPQPRVGTRYITWVHFEKNKKPEVAEPPEAIRYWSGIEPALVVMQDDQDPASAMFFSASRFSEQIFFVAPLNVVIKCDNKIEVPTSEGLVTVPLVPYSQALKKCRAKCHNDKDPEAVKKLQEQILVAPESIPRCGRHVRKQKEKKKKEDTQENIIGSRAVHEADNMFSEFYVEADNKILKADPDVLFKRFMASAQLKSGKQADYCNGCEGAIPGLCFCSLGDGKIHDEMDDDDFIDNLTTLHPGDHGFDIDKNLPWAEYVKKQEECRIQREQENEFRLKKAVRHKTFGHLNEPLLRAHYLSSTNEMHGHPRQVAPILLKTEVPGLDSFVSMLSKSAENAAAATKKQHKTYKIEKNPDLALMMRNYYKERDGEPCPDFPNTWHECMDDVENTAPLDDKNGGKTKPDNPKKTTQNGPIDKYLKKQDMGDDLVVLPSKDEGSKKRVACDNPNNNSVCLEDGTTTTSKKVKKEKEQNPDTKMASKDDAFIEVLGGPEDDADPSAAKEPIPVTDDKTMDTKKKPGPKSRKRKADEVKGDDTKKDEDDKKDGDNKKDENNKKGKEKKRDGNKKKRDEDVQEPEAKKPKRAPRKNTKKGGNASSDDEKGKESPNPERPDTHIYDNMTIMELNHEKEVLQDELQEVLRERRGLDSCKYQMEKNIEKAEKDIESMRAELIKVDRKMEALPLISNLQEEIRVFEKAIEKKQQEARTKEKKSTCIDVDEEPAHGVLYVDNMASKSSTALEEICKNATTSVISEAIAMCTKKNSGYDELRNLPGANGNLARLCIYEFVRTLTPAFDISDPKIISTKNNLVANVAEFWSRNKDKVKKMSSIQTLFENEPTTDIEKEKLLAIAILHKELQNVYSILTKSAEKKDEADEFDDFE